VVLITAPGGGWEHRKVEATPANATLLMGNEGALFKGIHFQHHCSLESPCIIMPYFPAKGGSSHDGLVSGNQHL